ncbi:carboxyl-terminal processing protease CtpZ [Synechococcus sp. CBW1107]|uniref:carboxyl-terminal processing protease CtpZ n=1 Tax=Synechococcus sp. CBW1107 TaxID=2789857 RepID=UPI00351C0CA2
MSRIKPLSSPLIPGRGRAMALALLLCVGLWLHPGPALALNDAQQLVVEAWRLVNQSYVDPTRFETVHWRRLRQKALEQPIETSAEAYDAIAAMLEPIGDPYTRVLRPADYKALRATTEGSVSGVGLQLSLGEDGQGIVVIAPLDGSPAAEAGISPGSEVLEVEGESCRRLGLEATAARLRGPSGSSVQMLIRPPTPQAEPRQVLLKRERVDLQPVRSRLLERGGQRLGLLRITQFSEPVPAGVREVLEGFGQQGVEGLILDLRNNSGGLVEAGVAVANAFLAAQPIVETMNREGLSERLQAAAGQLYSGPMVTLVNGGTASASEILAGALQDNGRSPLLGSRTFGKGLIQTLINLGDGSGLAVTVARYVTPSGRDIQDQGIAPDRLLPEPEPPNPGGADDHWLELAAEQLLQELPTA